VSESNWEVVEEVYGELQAEMLRGLLEAQGISVILNQEGAGRAYGINVGPLGQVQILVPSHAIQEARQVLEKYYAGSFETDDELKDEDEPDYPDEEQ
jgi:hypothetical protein